MEIFEQNPDLKEVFQTTDGEFFYTENAAKNHARSLEDKTVEHLKRTFELKVVTEDSEEEEVKELSISEKVEAMTKAQLVEFAKTTYDFEVNATLTRPEMLKIVQDLLTEKQ
jgi:hypothetical protein